LLDSKTTAQLASSDQMSVHHCKSLLKFLVEVLCCREILGLEDFMSVLQHSCYDDMVLLCKVDSAWVKKCTDYGVHDVSPKMLILEVD